MSPIMFVYNIFLFEVVRKMWTQDFKCTYASLNYHTPEVFTRCFWQKLDKVTSPWIVYRIVMAVYFIITWIACIINLGRDVKEEDAAKFPIFITNWSYTLETMQFLLAMIIVSIKAVEEKKTGYNVQAMKHMPWYYKLYWVLHTTTIPASICVTCIFWAAVYDPQYNPLDLINISTHVFNSIFMIIDFILVGHPYNIMHIYWPILYATAYMIFSVTYQLSGGTGTDGKIPLYVILDWEKPGAAILTCLMAVSLIMVTHVLFWLFYKGKIAVKKNYSNSFGGKREKEGIENLGMDLRVV